MKFSACVLFLMVFSLFLHGEPAFCSRKTSGEESYGSLKNKIESCLKELKKASERLSEVSFVSGHVHDFRMAVLSEDIQRTRYSGKKIIDRIDDRLLKNLIKNLYVAVDGTGTVNAYEREAYLKLCKELEAGLAAPDTLKREIGRLQKEIAPFIPSQVVRKMTRHARELARVTRGKEKLEREISSDEDAFRKEKNLCESSPVRSKELLRKLAGNIALNKKKLQLLDAAKTFADCLTQAVSDGKLLEDEKKLLTSAQAKYAQLQASVGGMSSI